MNRRELAALIAFKMSHAGNILRDVSHVEAEEFIVKFCEAVEEEIVKGSEVNIVGFGKFFSKIRKGRECINPRDLSKRIPVGPVKVIRFKPGSSLKKKVRECQASS